MTAVIANRESLEEISAEILQRAQTGDQEALRMIVQRYYMPVYHLVWRMLESAVGQARVEEITQDVFLKIHRSLPGFRDDGRAKFSTWIFTIATRTAISEMHRPRPVSTSGENDEVPDSRHLGPERELEKRRNRRAVRKALSEMSTDHRIIIVLREYHGLAYDEISEVLDIDMGTVKSRLSRAKDALRNALQEVIDV